MALHITQQQEGEIRNLVQRRCANYRKGNCLLLDGLEESTCVQLLCSSGIYCRYFQNAVLPREKELYTHILKQNTRRNVHESNKWNLPEANPGNRGYHAGVFWMLSMANKMHSPSFYKKTAVAFCCKKMSACAFGRNTTAIVEKAVAYPRRSNGKFPIWELTRCASKVVSGQNVHSPYNRS